MITLTDDNFETEVIASDLPVLVDFWAEWCGPCKAIAPMIESVAGDYAGKLKVGKLDTEDAELMTQKYGIRSIPTLLIFKDGNVVAQINGAVPRSKLEAELKKHL